MKKLFFAFMAVATIALIGCKKDEPTSPTTSGGGEGGGGETPTETIPEGYVKILIQVPDGEECHGIYLKGNVNGEWSGENTYVGETTGAATVENAIKFERIAEGSEFFAALFKLGSDGLEGAVCQKYPNDGSWQGKSRLVKLIDNITFTFFCKIFNNV